ncbi:MAG: phage holin family protein [Bdellovibrionia bacterium]
MEQLNESYHDPLANDRSAETGSPKLHTSNAPSFSSVAHEMTESIKAVIRSELHLAKAEFKENGSQAARYSVRMVIFAAIAALGIFPLLAFLVVGLGRLLNDNYWLSSLIVSVVLFGVGGGVAYLMLKKIKHVDFKFENTRDSVVTQLRTFERKIHEVADIAKTKASLNYTHTDETDNVTQIRSQTDSLNQTQTHPQTHPRRAS